MTLVRLTKPIDLPRSELARALRTFRPALRGERPRILAAVALALAVTGLELAKPWPITLVVDHLAGAGAASRPDETPSLAPIALFAAAAVAIPALLGMAGERLQLVVARVSRKATTRIRSDVFEHLQRLDLAEHRRLYRGDLLVRLMGDVNMIRDLLFPSWLALLSRGSVLIGGVVIFAVVDWRLFCVALVPLPLLWVGVERGSSAVNRAAGKQRRKEGAIASSAAESLRNVGIIKAFAAEQRTADEFRSTARSAERATMEATREAARMARLTEILTGAGVALVLVLGAMRARAGLLSIGELVLAISYTRMIYKPIRKLTGEGARLAKAAACASRVIELLERPIEDREAGIPVGRLAGHIELIGVSHRYGDGRTSLEGITARLDAGSLVAITGENGTGKSTLLSLLLRLQRPSSGEIRIDGTPIDDLQLTSYRQQIAYVPQELSLFSGTIRENLTFGRPDASESDIGNAVEAALLADVIRRLPDGLDTKLDEDGASLSGGEARRLMLARAALRHASIVLLDEPLAGLDPAARDAVAGAIANIAAGRTTLVVHHGDLDLLDPDDRLDLTHGPIPPRRRLEVVERTAVEHATAERRAVNE